MRRLQFVVLLLCLPIRYKCMVNTALPVGDFGPLRQESGICGDYRISGMTGECRRRVVILCLLIYMCQGFTQILSHESAMRSEKE